MHTYCSIYIHVVFSTWDRCPFIDHEVRSRFHAYIAGTARNLGLLGVTVGGVEDHLHLIARFSPAQSISSVIGAMKKSATDWMQTTLKAIFAGREGSGRSP